jgi:hypothetical protein
MGCILRIHWAGTAVLNDARWWKVMAYGSYHDHPFIKFVGVEILIAKKVASV